MHAQFACGYGQGVTRRLKLPGEIESKERLEDHLIKGQLVGNRLHQKTSLIRTLFIRYDAGELHTQLSISEGMS